MKCKKNYFLFTCLFISQLGFAQIPNLPTPHNITPSTVFSPPDVVNMSSYSVKNKMNVPLSGNIALQKQNETLIDQTQKVINAQIEEQQHQIYYQQQEKEFAKTYFLPSLSDKAGATAYYSAFESLSKLNPDNYSIADATFLVENAFYNNDKNFQNTYQNYIQKATKIIQTEINKKGISDDDNASKNFTLFKYFAKDITGDVPESFLYPIYR
ncbi:hypothetical protein [Chryseobacterium mulctrae]|uniref:hypothetical protein n=1 Tax=Chryseobacterium mulctrae TaxID=2576777 RepID=UPI001116F285|nr:hypothetical protein [Chryseobacterium mulctrae]